MEEIEMDGIVYIPMREACRVLQLSRTALHYLVTTGNQARRMFCLKQGCHWYIPVSELTEFPFIDKGWATVKKVFRYNKNLQRYEWGLFVVRTGEFIENPKWKQAPINS